jgi:hypothetical protein
MNENLLNFKGFVNDIDLTGVFQVRVVPRHTQEAIERYLVDGLPAGSFLEAVITNNLFMSVGHADVANKQHLVSIVEWFAQRAPLESYGSKVAYTAWLRDENGQRTEYAERLRKERVFNLLQEQ